MRWSVLTMLLRAVEKKWSIIIWAPSREKGSSDFPSNPAFSVHVRLLNEATYLMLWLVPSELPLTWANSIGSGETVRMLSAYAIMLFFFVVVVFCFLLLFFFSVFFFFFFLFIFFFFFVFPWWRLYKFLLVIYCYEMRVHTFFYTKCYKEWLETSDTGRRNLVLLHNFGFKIHFR